MRSSAPPDEVRLGPLSPFRDTAWGVFLCVLIFLALGNAGRYLVYIHLNGPAGFGAYLDALCVWDCAWYRTIVEHGYDAAPVEHLRPGGANWAFFPLYPLSVKALTLVGLPVVFAGFAASSAFIAIAAIAARPLLRGPAATWWLWSFALLAGPFSMLFATLYTESLFILLIVLSLRALAEGNYLRAGLWAALLSATRVTGVLMTLALIVGIVVDLRRDGHPWHRLPAIILGRADIVLAIFVAPLGLFAYMAYMRWLTGDGFAFMHIQRPWGRDFDNPLFLLWQSLTPPMPLTANTMVRFTWGIAAAIGLGLSGWLILTRRAAAGTFTALALLASLTTGVTSMIRFSAGLAPLGMVASEAASRWRPLFWLCFPLAYVAGLFITLGWFRSSLFVM